MATLARGLALMILAMTELISMFLALPTVLVMADESLVWYIKASPVALLICGLVASVIMFHSAIKTLVHSNEIVLGQKPHDNKLLTFTRYIKRKREIKKYGYPLCEIQNQTIRIRQ